MAERYKTVSHVVHAEVQGELAILDPVGSRYYGLDEVGAFVWTALATPQTASELTASVLEAYDAPEDAVRGDIDALLASLLTAGLIETC